jgi:hypothetical protein
MWSNVCYNWTSKRCCYSVLGCDLIIFLHDG